MERRTWSSMFAASFSRQMGLKGELNSSQHMEMTTDKEYINHYLFKNEVSLSKNDFTFGEPQRVIHFRMN